MSDERQNCVPNFAFLFIVKLQDHRRTLGENNLYWTLYFQTVKLSNICKVKLVDHFTHYCECNVVSPKHML